MLFRHALDASGSAGWLLEHLPGLVERIGPAWLDPTPVDSALSVLADARPAIQRLPRQLVHGDIGPDNVLYDGDDVVAIIDFTPFYESRLFGVCTALYWFHVHPGRMEGLELAHELCGPMLLGEALRRLATPLAATDEIGTPVAEAALRGRYEALLRSLRWPTIRRTWSA